MSSFFKKVLSLLFVVLFSASYCTSFASASTSSYTTGYNFWHWLDKKPVIHAFTSGLLGYISSTDVCPKSSDSKHHASEITGVSDDDYFICVCENCGAEFTSSTRASSIYSSYSSAIPYSSITSGNQYAVKLNWNDNLTYGKYRTSTGPLQRVSWVDCGDYYSLSFASARIYTLRFVSNYVKPPLGATISCDSTLRFYDNTNHDGPYSFSYSSSYVYNNSSNDGVRFFVELKDKYPQTLYMTELHCYLPRYALVTVDSVPSTSASIYTDSSRPASVSGNFGISSSTGSIISTESTSIVNETDNSVYNPVTNTTYDMQEWTYDYSDRSYHITTTSGDSLTVTYGDENLTIQEGDTVYNVYYLLNTSGSGSGSSSHVHTYSSVITRQATCTDPGLRTYTCIDGDSSYTDSIDPLGHNYVLIYQGTGDSVGGSAVSYQTYRCTRCGDSYNVSLSSVPSGHTHSYSSSVTTEPTCQTSGVRTFTCISGDDTYTEPIDALGHSWVVKDQVNTEYDSSGNLVQEGYTIYKCSRCGEEYKNSSASSASPGGSGSTVVRSGGGLFSGIFGLFWDFCSFMFGFFEDFISGGIHGFLSALSDGASDFFKILNPLNWFS